MFQLGVAYLNVFSKIDWTYTFCHTCHTRTSRRDELADDSLARISVKTFDHTSDTRTAARPCDCVNGFVATSSGRTSSRIDRTRTVFRQNDTSHVSLLCDRMWRNSFHISCRSTTICVPCGL